MVLGVVLIAAAFAIATAWRHPRVAPVSVAPAPVAPAKVSDAAFETPAQPQQRMVVAFKLPTDITRGHYLGERWVSPPKFAFAQAGREYTAQAKLQQVGDDGTRTDLSGDWSTSDPNMIAISHDAAGQVTLVVREPGEAQLTASAGGQRKVLKVRATRTDDAMEVAFVQ
ncbi:hypothetical protein LF41_833 [Lysobacter dokdonensis DS-58]|uniref:Uncharacterized protein n=1 Tax=Lysobacter dokdonensis DS-58 TaxID=1300345 RepID=A0A0A2WNI5_9GAMM|nr:hypothetical protein LF41_833 [Lysobacter dokdonensis DS-58]